MRWLAALPLLLGLSLQTTAASLAAQHPDSLARALRAIPPSRTVRLATPTATLLGQLRLVDSDVVTVERDGLTRRLRLNEITAVWVRGRHTVPGAIVGGAVGLGAGLFLGALAKGLCEYDCADGVTPYLYLGALGSAAGAGLGAIVGAAIPKWRRWAP